MSKIIIQVTVSNLVDKTLEQVEERYQKKLGDNYVVFCDIW